VLKKLPKSFDSNFRNHCVKVINERFNEFDDNKYLTYFFLDPHMRNIPLKKTCFKRIIKCVASTGKRLGFDLYEMDVLLDQFQKYIDLDLSVAKKNLCRWWRMTFTAPEPKLLSKVACHLLSICPNSATCERGFSTLGWLFERRLNLKLETLESMCKLIITYWKSNFKTELGYYGIDQKKNVRLSDDEISIRIAEAFKEIDEEEEEDLASTHKFTGGEQIPKDNCYVLIKPVWIENFIDLSHESIIKDIDVPKDIFDDFDENIFNENMNNNNRVGNDEKNNDDEKNNNGENKKGVYDYNVDDLFDFGDEEENGDE